MTQCLWIGSGDTIALTTASLSLSSLHFYVHLVQTPNFLLIIIMPFDFITNEKINPNAKLELARMETRVIEAETRKKEAECRQKEAERDLKRLELEKLNLENEKEQMKKEAEERGVVSTTS